MEHGIAFVNGWMERKESLKFIQTLNWMLYVMNYEIFETLYTEARQRSKKLALDPILRA